MLIMENNLNYLLAKMWNNFWVQLCLLLQLQEKQIKHVEQFKLQTNVEIFEETNTVPWIWWRVQD